jgi:hypothetical protein
LLDASRKIDRNRTAASDKEERTAVNLRQQVEAAEEFLRELGRGIPEEERVMVGYAKEATVQKDETGKALKAGWWPVAWSDGKYIDGNANAYACISSSKKTPNPRTGTLRYWRGEASFGHGLALMVDDVGNGKGSKGGLALDVVRGILEPTAIVETSPSNFQCWYFFDQPCADMGLFKAFLVGFVAGVLVNKGGDTTIRDVSRYGRMPVGINNKRTNSGELKYPVWDGDGRESPVRVRLVSADYSVRYSMRHIAAKFGFQIVRPVHVRRSDSQLAEVDSDNFYNAIWLRMAVDILNKFQMGEGSNGAVVQNMSGKYRIVCPWGDEHSNGDSSGAYFRDRIPGAEYDFVFGCAHDTCRKQNKRTWSTFVDHVVMPWIADALLQANRKQENWLLSDYSEVRK